MCWTGSASLKLGRGREKEKREGEREGLGESTVAACDVRTRPSARNVPPFKIDTAAVLLRGLSQNMSTGPDM